MLRRRKPLAAVALLALTVVFAGSSAGAARHPCVVPGAREPLDAIWRPGMAAARAYAARRTGDIAFAVRTGHHFYGYRANHVEWSASVVKAMLMVAYLRRPSVRARRLGHYDRALLVPMITRSDNAAATTVDGIVGNSGLAALARRVGMTRFTPVANPWGETRITARDQTLFFLHIDRYIPARHRAFAMRLLESITPSQRWGIGEVAPHGWQLYFKGGWGYGTGLLDHQVALLRRGCARVSVAVLSMYDGSHAYGKATLRGIFARLLRHFPTGQPLYPIVPGAHYTGTLAGGRGTISFYTGHGGERVGSLALTVDGDSACAPAGEAQTFRLAAAAIDPDGHFVYRASVGSSSLSITGRFVGRGRATGQVAQQTASSACMLRTAWSATAHRA